MKKILTALLVVGSLLLGTGLVTQPVMADDIGDICEDGNGIPDDLKEAAGCNVDEGKSAMPAVSYLVNVALSVVGIIAVGVIIYGAVTYIISTGDAAKLNRAKNSILYGVVGLVVAMLAYTIVYFVTRSLFGGNS